MSDFEGMIAAEAVDAAEGLGRQVRELRRLLDDAVDACADLGWMYAAAVVANARLEGQLAELDRQVDALLRCYLPVRVPGNAGKHPAESDES